MPSRRYRVLSREFKEAAVRRVLAREKVRAVGTNLQIVTDLPITAGISTKPVASSA